METAQIEILDTPAPLSEDQTKRLNLQAKSYQEEVWEGSWKGRTRGLWSGVALGVFFGSIFGAISALSVVLVGASMASALALAVPMAGIYAIAGMAMGMAICTDAGAASGAVASGLKEQDRRKLETHPELASTLGKPRGDTSRDFWRNPTGYFTQGSKKLFNWKVALFGMLCGLALAALFLAAASPIGVMGAVTAIFVKTGIISAGLSAEAAAAAAAPFVSAITFTSMGLMGGFFGVDMPTIGRNTANFMGEILSGNIFERRKALAIEPAVAPALPRSAQVRPTPVFDTVKTTQQGATVEARNLMRAQAEQQLREMDTSQAMRH